MFLYEKIRRLLFRAFGLQHTEAHSFIAWPSHQFADIPLG
jgi:hypothetical protein